MTASTLAPQARCSRCRWRRRPRGASDRPRATTTRLRPRVPRVMCPSTSSSAASAARRSCAMPRTVCLSARRTRRSRRETCSTDSSDCRRPIPRAKRSGHTGGDRRASGAPVTRTGCRSIRSLQTSHGCRRRFHRSNDWTIHGSDVDLGARSIDNLAITSLAEAGPSWISRGLAERLVREPGCDPCRRSH
jgi:hypothetical protein